MSTALISTGVQFPDATIQTTAATSLVTYTYENRAALRTTTPSANLASIAVQDLGVFTYVPNNTEPDDDETCFVVAGSGGSWQLLSPTLEMVQNLQMMEMDYLLNSRMTSFTCFNQSVDCMYSGTTVVMSVCMPGATPGDLVIANPINWSCGACNCSVHYYANIPCPNCMWLYFNNYNYNNCTCYFTVTCGMSVSICPAIFTTPFCGCGTIWKAATFRTPL